MPSTAEAAAGAASACPRAKEPPPPGLAIVGFSAEWRADRINNFDVGPDGSFHDHIVFNGVGSIFDDPMQFHAVDVDNGADTLIRYGTDPLLPVGVHRSQLIADDFRFHRLA